MDNFNYYLVLEKRPGDYELVDINKLDINNQFVLNDIAAIDTFTMKFTELELRDAISRSNMVNQDYLYGKLRIISDVKHNLSVITKEVYERVINFNNDTLEIDRDFKNKLFGIYKKIIEKSFNDSDFIKGMLDRFKKCLKEENKKEFMKIIEELPYAKSRIIYIAISMEEERKKDLNLKKLEKLNTEE